MTVRTMRRLDRWIGTPLCLLLTLHRRFGDAWRWLRRIGPPAFRMPGDARPGPCVLFVKLAEMGSTVLAVPAIRRLQEMAPGVRLHYLCFEENKAVLDLLPGVRWEGVHTIRTRSIVSVVADVLRVVLRLRRLRFDAAFDMEFFSRGSAALVYLSGARVRVGYHRFHAEGLNCGDLFTHRLAYNHHLHTSGAFLALAEALTAPAGEVPLVKKRVDRPVALPAFEPAAHEVEAVLEKLRSRGYPAAGRPPIVILNTNASDLLPLRRWPMERFEELARRCLSAYPDCWIVLTGSPAEAPAVESLARRIGNGRVICLAGHTTLRELVTLYGFSEVIVTNDSGPAHFAALTPIRILVLFGPETPELYGPLSPRGRAVSAALACSPCIHVFNSRNSPCTDNRCMKLISVDDVFRTMRELWDGARTATGG